MQKINVVCNNINFFLTYLKGKIVHCPSYYTWSQICSEAVKLMLNSVYFGVSALYIDVLWLKRILSIEMLKRQTRVYIIVQQS